MNKLKETLERHGMELRSDQCTCVLPAARKMRWCTRRNEANCEVDTTGSDDFGNGM